MYNRYFGFAESPFGASPEPRFFYLNASYKEAFVTLRYGIESRKGFIVFVGEAGTGKTTLLQQIIEYAEPDLWLVSIARSALPGPDLLREVAGGLGLSRTAGDRPETLARIHESLIAHRARGRNVSLLMDEAQSLGADSLEALRLLSNMQTQSESLIQIVLAGQPELDDRLEQPELRAVKQRVALRCRVEPLKPREIRFYIDSRLMAVNYPHRELFDAAAVGRIAVHSGGIPRSINLLCDNALLIARAAGASRVTADSVEEAALNLHLLKN